MALKNVFRLTQRAGRPEDAADAASTSISISPAEELRSFQRQHKWDPFLDNEKLDTIESAIQSDNVEKQEKVDGALIQENSPYVEVRAAVPPTDDPDMPVNTIRAWFLGTVLCTIVAACNVLLSMHRTSANISSTVVQLIAYPLGVGMAKVLPNKEHNIMGLRFNLNPGPFNVKEHTIITIMTAAGTAFSYAIDILLAQEVFYNQHFQWGFQILLIISTQAMGFGIAGVARRFLVWPSSMLWPANLVTCTIMYSLHKHVPADPAETHGWAISRYKFFLIVSLSAFVYHWIPEVFAQFLQFFTFACWIAPNNVVVNQLFGGFTGLGMIPITFDWMVVSSWLNSPLQSPLFAILNMGFGFFICMIGAIGLAYAGPEFYKYLPLSANKNWDRFAKPYNTSRILTPQYTVNETAYEQYSPILLGATFSLSYAMSFATLISTLTHCALFYGPDIWRRCRNAKSEEPDVHLKLMRRYKEAPEWWFAVIFVLSFVFGMLASQLWETHLPWWAYIVCILIAIVFFIPIGMIQAITNQQPGLNVITEMIFGYMLPGRPVAMMLFKSWGYMTCFNGLNYVSDMKIGHYMKVPPRTMFAAQAFAVIWLSIVQICTYNFLIGNIDKICTDEQPQGLICPNALTFYNASVIWGVIGPRRVFGAGGIFAWINWFWLIGFVMPVLQYLIARRYPRSFVRFVIWPAIFSACGLVPPATLYYMFPWVVVGVIFNGWIRRRYFGWWAQYNYVLSGALDIGSRLCVVIVALALGLSNRDFPSWWGNTVMNETMDRTGKAVQKRFIPNVTEPIGPSHW
ncbi:small oligopeptide transporter, OPT family [Pochonia chlamydosporia 170]|uniref:Small oligopeptide transporter, OPT family n=1 Tax=Pochonia chlamydosporia 170 TaxID=1380566 RepID=A0A179FI51_METCM|nr:small oligopeptide transporter, OPT family [Pochonia chlamydosporia 170]OAQ64683.1 small oligopeptide transporter, OPT family [Pochonia chlamydosporia 170]